jgi:N-acetylmuramoyl-L-alanine amidase
LNTLAENGFGLWKDDILQTAPLDFNSEQALRIIGYDTQNLPASKHLNYTLSKRS